MKIDCHQLLVQRDKLANENKSLRQSIKEEEEKFKLSKEEMNEREVLTNALKAQYEANVDRLKKELDQLNNEIEKLSNELKEMETRKRYMMCLYFTLLYTSSSASYVRELITKCIANLNIPRADFCKQLQNHFQNEHYQFCNCTQSRQKSISSCYCSIVLFSICS